MEERRKNSPGRGERRKGDAVRIAKALKRRGRILLHVHGTGMVPLVRPGDIALIRRERLDNMRSGDVVLFQRGEQLLAKRIGEEEDLAGEVTLSMDVEVDGTATASKVQQECLGKIVGVKRDRKHMEMSAAETPIKKRYGFQPGQPTLANTARMGHPGSLRAEKFQGSENPEALVSLMLKPARRGKHALQLSKGAN
jgi:hypothetical protein